LWQALQVFADAAVWDRGRRVGSFRGPMSHVGEVICRPRHRMKIVIGRDGDGKVVVG